MCGSPRQNRGLPPIYLYILRRPNGKNAAQDGAVT